MTASVTTEEAGQLSDREALLRMATLMDEDDDRTGRVGIPASYGHHLLWVALAGPDGSWNREYVRRLRTEGPEEVKAWAERLEAQERRLIGLVYPSGAAARPVSAGDVRTLAKQADSEAGR